MSIKYQNPKHQHCTAVTADNLAAQGYLDTFIYSTVGWSEKHKSWKMQQFKADSEPRHSTDFRTIFGIMIG